MVGTDTPVSTVTPSTRSGFTQMLTKIKSGLDQLQGKQPDLGENETPLNMIGGILKGVGNMVGGLGGGGPVQTHSMLGAPQTGLSLGPSRRPQLDPDQQRLAIMQAFNMQG